MYVNTEYMLCQKWLLSLLSKGTLCCVCVFVCVWVRERGRMPHKQCCPEGKKEHERIERWKVKGSRSYSTTKPWDTHTHTHTRPCWQTYTYFNKIVHFPCLSAALLCGQCAACSILCVCCLCEVHYTPRSFPAPLTPINIIYVPYITTYSTSTRDRWMCFPQHWEPGSLDLGRTRAATQVSATAWLGLGWRGNRGRNTGLEQGLQWNADHMAQAFSLLLSLSISYCPPCSSFLALSPAISLT